MTADEAYGKDHKFRTWLEHRGIGYVVAVPRNQTIPALDGIYPAPMSSSRTRPLKPGNAVAAARAPKPSENLLRCKRRWPEVLSIVSPVVRQEVWGPIVAMARSTASPKVPFAPEASQEYCAATKHPNAAAVRARGVGSSAA